MDFYFHRCLRDGASAMNRKELLLRIIGFVGSVILTLAAYFIIVQPEYFHLEIKTALIIIFVLAVLQLMVQFLFFLNIWRERGTYWNVGVFVSFLSTVVIIVFFSIWIINHLNYNMM
jgi:cytochrome o ubiquinol oxidase operon protein cyoD